MVAEAILDLNFQRKCSSWASGSQNFACGACNGCVTVRKRFVFVFCLGGPSPPRGRAGAHLPGNQNRSARLVGQPWPTLRAPRALAHRCAIGGVLRRLLALLAQLLARRGVGFRPAGAWRHHQRPAGGRRGALLRWHAENSTRTSSGQPCSETFDYYITVLHGHLPITARVPHISVRVRRVRAEGEQYHRPTYYKYKLKLL